MSTPETAGYQPTGSGCASSPPRGGSGASKNINYSPCDEDIRMFVIAELGMDCFMKSLANSPAATINMLSRMVRLIRDGTCDLPQPPPPDT